MSSSKDGSAGKRRSSRDSRGSRRSSSGRRRSSGGASPRAIAPVITIEEAEPLTRMPTAKKLVLNSLIRQPGPRLPPSKNVRRLGHLPPSRAFAVVFEVDGVLKRGDDWLDGAKAAVLSLCYQDTTANVLRPRIPLLFTSNRGGCTEAAYAARLASELGVALDEDHVILGHTPMLDTARSLKDQRVLVVGNGRNDDADAKAVAEAYGLSNFETLVGFQKKFPPWDPMPPSEQFAAFLIFDLPDDWYPALQTLIDLLVSHTSGKKGLQASVHLAHSDVLYAGAYQGYPRFDLGAFRVCMATLYTAMTMRTLHVKEYGKPKPSFYTWCETGLRRQLSARSQNSSTTIVEVKKETPNGESFEKKDFTTTASYEISFLPPRIYAIGDNPTRDIHGANSAGRRWVSILTRQGYWKSAQQHPKYAARHICASAKAATELISSMEAKMASK